MLSQEYSRAQRAWVMSRTADSFGSTYIEADVIEVTSTGPVPAHPSTTVRLAPRNQFVFIATFPSTRTHARRVPGSEAKWSVCVKARRRSCCRRPSRFRSSPSACRHCVLRGRRPPRVPSGHQKSRRLRQLVRAQHRCWRHNASREHLEGRPRCKRPRRWARSTP